MAVNSVAWIGSYEREGGEMVGCSLQITNRLERLWRYGILHTLLKIFYEFKA